MNAEQDLIRQVAQAVAGSKVRIIDLDSRGKSACRIGRRIRRSCSP